MKYSKLTNIHWFIYSKHPVLGEKLLPTRFDCVHATLEICFYPKANKQFNVYTQVFRTKRQAHEIELYKIDRKCYIIPPVTNNIIIGSQYDNHKSDVNSIDEVLTIVKNCFTEKIMQHKIDNMELYRNVSFVEKNIIRNFEEYLLTESKT